MSSPTTGQLSVQLVSAEDDIMIPPKKTRFRDGLFVGHSFTSVDCLVLNNSGVSKINPQQSSREQWNQTYTNSSTSSWKTSEALDLIVNEEFGIYKKAELSPETIKQGFS